MVPEKWAEQAQGDKAASYGAHQFCTSIATKAADFQSYMKAKKVWGEGLERGQWGNLLDFHSTEERTKDVSKCILCLMKGGMTDLLKVGEGINSVWERLWKILKVNKICFYLMWWGGMKWREKKKAGLECWVKVVIMQWNLEGNRRGILLPAVPSVWNSGVVKGGRAPECWGSQQYLWQWLGL